MKRTKLFLIASCLLIAGVGIAATKAKTINKTFYFLNGSACIAEIIPDPDCITGGSGCVDGSNRQLFSDNACRIILKVY